MYETNDILTSWNQQNADRTSRLCNINNVLDFVAAPSFDFSAAAQGEIL